MPLPEARLTRVSAAPDLLRALEEIEQKLNALIRKLNEIEEALEELKQGGG